jgi:hypothetical protein
MTTMAVRMNWTPRIALLALVLPLSGCDVIAYLLVAPFFPGVQQLPAPEYDCPIGTPSAGELPPLPESFSVDAPSVPADCAIGAPAIHRLNRSELTHSLSDVLGVDASVQISQFPNDDVGGGFDNNADLLTVSPLFFEKLEESTRALVDEALARPGEKPVTVVKEAEYGLGDGGPDGETGRYQLGGGATVETPAILPNAAGTFIVRARVGVREGVRDTPSKATLIVDGTELVTAKVTANDEDMQLIEGTGTLNSGPVHRLGLRYENESPGTLLVDFFEVVGPVAVEELGPDSRSRKAIVGCNDDADTMDTACARASIRALAERAWRRPLETDEGKALDAAFDAQVDEGDGAERAMRTVMSAILSSPRFVFRHEIDDEAGAHLIDDVELAARMSYFIWSSTPDDRLLELAAMGALQDEDVLATEVQRMLDDPKSAALVEGFAGQWLYTRALDGMAPDPERFPGFDEEVRSAMKCETALGFDRYLRDPTLNALDMIDDDTTFVNTRLAEHYGLTPPESEGIDTLPDGWGLVSLAGTTRTGLLTSGTLLTVTSQPTRTSPTKRGKWVLENLLCETPMLPPPGVEGMIVDDVDQAGTIREQLEQHRSDPACASCHATMDPIGLALEHYDAIGRYRGSDGGFAIDDSVLWFGNRVDGPRELGRAVKESGLVPACMGKKMLTYALGRELTDADFCLLDPIVERFVEKDYALSELVVSVVLSPAFRMRDVSEGVTP